MKDAIGYQTVRRHVSERKQIDTPVTASGSTFIVPLILCFFSLAVNSQIAVYPPLLFKRNKTDDVTVTCCGLMTSSLSPSVMIPGVRFTVCVMVCASLLAAM